VTLDGDTTIDSSKWINLPYTPDPNCSYSPFLGGIENDKLFFTTSNPFDVKNHFTTRNFFDVKNHFTTKKFDSKYFSFFEGGEYDAKYIDIFDTTLNNISYAIDIFDTIDFEWSVSTIIPILYWDYIDQSVFGPPRVFLPSGKIIHIGGKPESHSSTKLMEKLLTYDTITDSWEIINTIGEIPAERTFHTAVLTKDGRVIIYGGTSNKIPDYPAYPYLAILNTSNYEWTAPKAINSIGPVAYHTSIIIENYMIVAFGVNVTNDEFIQSIYKLDISNPSIYKWSLLSSYNSFWENLYYQIIFVVIFVLVV
ncbi:22572_t:CDS:2, partial [Dentiscutata erythropus]